VKTIEIFGNWINGYKDLKMHKSPFDHILIDNFFNEKHINLLYSEIKSQNTDEMWIYKNPFEVQFVLNKWDFFGPETYRTLFALCSPNFSEIVSNLFDIEVIADFGLHGGGIVQYPNKGKLNAHLDYETHPKLNMVRNVNLLVYLNPEWEESWGGALNLYSQNTSGNLICEKTFECKFNRAIFFNTNQNSWHGLPDEISCPDEQTRIALNLYYLNNKITGKFNRYRAHFMPTEEQKSNMSEIENLVTMRADKKNPKYD
jgi:hypothetical protein